MLTAGTPYLIAFDVRGDDGALANAVSVTLTISLPDGTTAAPTVTNPPAETGKYRYSYLPPQTGFFQWSAVTTSPGRSFADSFHVREFASILNLAEAKQHLNLTGTADDDEIRNFLQAATELTESKAGACVRRTVTERVFGGTQNEILVTRYPLLSVTSVTSTQAGGPSWSSGQLAPDLDAGIIRPQPGAAQFYGGPWDAVYVAGRAVIPERYLDAGKELLRHLWETQRGATPALPALGGEGETFTTSTGLTFAIPNRVLELLAGDMTPAF